MDTRELEVTRDLVRNTIYKAVNSVFLRGISLLYAVFVVRFLSKEQYGLLVLTLTVVGLVNGLTNLGLPVMALKSISKYFGKDSDKAASYYRFTSRLYGGITFVSGLLLFFAAPLAAKLYDWPEVASLVRLGSLLFIFLSFYNFYNRVVVAINKYAAYVFKFDLPKEILVLLGAVLVVSFDYQAAGVLAAQIMAYCLAVIALTFFIFRNLRGAAVPVDRKGVVKGALEITPQSWASTAIGNTDILIIGAFVALPVLASYKVAMSVLTIVSQLLAFGMFILPTLNRLSREEAQKIFNKVLLFTLAGVSPIIFFVFSFSREILWILFGDKYAPDYPLLSILSFLLIWQILAPVFVNTLVYLGKMATLGKMWGIAALLYAGLMYMLVQGYGLTGAIAGLFFMSYSLLVTMGMQIYKAGIDIELRQLRILMLSATPLLFCLTNFWIESLPLRGLLFTLSGTVYLAILYKYNLFSPYRIVRVFSNALLKSSATRGRDI